MICFGELLRKRDVLEENRKDIPSGKDFFDIQILAVDLRISRIQI
jgi:hypothetical protein